MSTALQINSNHHGIEDLHKMSCVGILDPPEIVAGGDLRLGTAVTLPSKVAVKVVEERESRMSGPCSSSSSSLSSSIGKNSDLSVKSSSEGDDDGGENEVQSSLKGSFNSTMDALEKALPIRRGISRFYNGKSKSFASLAEASGCVSIKDITKPENAYSRKRRNLLGYSLLWDNKKPSSPLKSCGGGISKRPTNASRSTLALAVAMSASSSTTDGMKPDFSNSNWRSLRPSPPSPPLSPLAPRNSTPWRSFSLADLQQCSSAANSNSPSPLSNELT
ncbi:hypothetical protein Ancab_023124 [Ancistrocladus abbreviatus]